ncbi:FAD-binding oxidoreductase [Desertihabitans brevis]|uniref:FAD-binding oxidoreductase n=2 Tax=Desertihabitans brevis TaxID=2268447 RepID=A0A367YST3_9ACTN|nr:FAD-binding oxidoreductase [Desertihabitans brevis]
MGAAVACFCARAGLSVTVLDRGAPGGGTSSAGEGNLLVSDKEQGPELDLALYSLGIWSGELAEGADRWEYEPKGGIVVARHETELAALQELTRAQRAAGVEAVDVDLPDLLTMEPHLDPGMAGAAFYPQDAQVQPVLATLHLLALARAAGAVVRPGETVTAIERSGDRVVAVRTDHGRVPCGAVVNAAGPWAGAVAELAGVSVPVLPRRGFVLVSEPVPLTVRHKVYAADYVADVGSSDDALQSSPVVEGTPAGTILIGSTRERVGFDKTASPVALARLAQGAIGLFPGLAGLRALRCYSGFRPYLPDHLPAVGEDARLPGLWHACGHEGAGIGCSVGTGKLLSQALRGERPDLDLTPFAPARFEEVLAA